jgi:hypothetical protein
MRIHVNNLSIIQQCNLRVSAYFTLHIRPKFLYTALLEIFD